MLNQIFENNGVNGTGTLCKGSSPGRCSPAQQRGPARHLATARLKWNKEVGRLMRKENLLGDTERGCLENEEKGKCLNQQNNVCV